MRSVVLNCGVLLVTAGLAVFTLLRPPHANPRHAASPPPVRPLSIPASPTPPAKVAAASDPGSDLGSLRFRVFASPVADAIELLSTLAESPENAKLIVEFMEHLACVGNWESIKSAVSNIPEGAGTRGGLNHASRIWAGVDPEGLIAWSDTLNSETLRQHVGLGISNY